MVVGFLTIVLFACAAIAIDLGNAYTRARSQQSRADLAALSAGNLLPVSDDTEKLAAANRIADYINQFRLQDDRSGGPIKTYTGQGLIDSGAVTFPSDDRVDFNAPDVKVDFGLGRALGIDSLWVRRSAAVQVFSLDGDVIAPLYAVTGCDYGAQVLKDQPNGKTPDTIPPLEFTGGSDSNNKISMTGPVANVAQGATPLPKLALAGDFDGKDGLIDKVGFFRATDGPTAPFTYTATPMNVTPSTADVTVPTQVVLDSGTWFIRVSEGNKWSDATVKAVLLVGAAATPTCPAGSSGGNFGQLGFGDESNPNDDIAHIFKDGPDHTIVSYPGSPTPGECGGLPAPAVIYDGTKDEANCVHTEPGFKPNAATAGLLSDSDSRLRVDTSTRCGSTRTTAGSWSINNDFLSCFFTDDTTTIATIANSGYSGPAVLSPDIVKSPRFFFVPIFSEEPDQGKKVYKITGFRPAFLTDQPTTATRADGPLAGNGITVGSNGKVAALNFILFDEDALPETLDSGVPSSPTYSFGPPIVKLVN